MHRTSRYPSPRRCVLAQHVNGTIEMSPELLHTLVRTRVHPERRFPMQQDTCAACRRPDSHLAIATGDCECLICEDCANQFLDAGQCGVCGILFTEDPPAEDADDA